MNLDPVTLEGEYVRLEPLSPDDHIAGLQEAGSDPTIFRWFTRSLADPKAMREWINAAMTAWDDSTALPFAMVWRETDCVIGSTRFGNVAPEHRRVEIGWTWITPDYQRTPANTEAKYHMLTHAFEEWECRRVEFKTDSRNRRSRAALERIGAREEGILRQHQNTHQGIRDTVYFSVLDTEWPAVKQTLESKLERPYSDR